VYVHSSGEVGSFYTILLSIDDWWRANNNCDGPPCSLPHRQAQKMQAKKHKHPAYEGVKSPGNLFMTWQVKGVMSG